MCAFAKDEQALGKCASVGAAVVPALFLKHAQTPPDTALSACLLSLIRTVLN